MPTPDPEALDARLRAVERALTDPDATLDPPADAPGATTPPEDGHDGATIGADDSTPGPDSDRRPARYGTAPDLPAPSADADRVPGPADGSEESPDPVDPSPLEDEGTDTGAGTGHGAPERVPSGVLERRLLDLEAAVRALRGCLEMEPEDGDDRPGDGGAGMRVPEPAGGQRPNRAWPDDLAADGGHPGRDDPRE